MVVIELPDWCLAVSAAALCSGLAFFVLSKSLKRLLFTPSPAKFALAGKDVVVLHQLQRPILSRHPDVDVVALSISPFPPKLECWLRANGIEYVNDYTAPMSPKTGKMPWVSVNGEEIPDTQLVMEKLKEMGLAQDFNQVLTPAELSVSRSFLSLLDNDYFCSHLAERILKYGGRYMQPYMTMPDGKVMPRIVSWFVLKAGMTPFTQTKYKAQGRDKFGVEHCIDGGVETLKHLSNFLGKKDYFMGKDKPTDIDFALFGFVHMTLLTSHPDSRLKKAIEEDCVNLVQHFERMKRQFFPDWEQIMSGKQITFDEFVKQKAKKQ